MIYMFLSNNPSSGDINSSNLSCLYFVSILLMAYTILNEQHFLNIVVCIY